MPKAIKIRRLPRPEKMATRRPASIRPRDPVPAVHGRLYLPRLSRRACRKRCCIDSTVGRALSAGVLGYRQRQPMHLQRDLLLRRLYLPYLLRRRCLAVACICSSVLLICPRISCLPCLPCFLCCIFLCTLCIGRVTLGVRYCIMILSCHMSICPSLSLSHACLLLRMRCCTLNICQPLSVCGIVCSRMPCRLHGLCRLCRMLGSCTACCLLCRSCRSRRGGAPAHPALQLPLVILAHCGRARWCARGGRGTVL